MKKFFILVILLFLSANYATAKTGISFIYINGSNNNNQNMKTWYEKGVAKLHPDLKHAFENNPDSKKLFLKDGEYYIEPTAKVFFWGDKSQEELIWVLENLMISKGISPWLAFRIRYFIVQCMHDAIWVQKDHNMRPILEELHQYVKDEYTAGKQTVIYGYSAGAFISYEYIFNRLPYIDLTEFFNRLGVSKSRKEFISQNPQKNTCIDALIQSGVSVLSINGHMVPVIDNEVFKKRYLSLNDYTDKICTPHGALRGIVNFASPLLLFYSDLADPNYDINFYNQVLYKYIIENDLFWLTVNFREDPLGFPNSRNLTNEEIKKSLGIEFTEGDGFIFDHSDVWSHRTTFNAHTAYWSAHKLLAKAIAQTYIDGYKFQYDKEYQTEILKKYKKRTATIEKNMQKVRTKVLN